jgi:hypothetical protein
MLDIVVFVIGLSVILTGRWPIGGIFGGASVKRPVIQAKDARTAGVFLLASLPVNLLIGFSMGLLGALMGYEKTTLTIFVFVLNLAIIFTAVVFANRFIQNKAKQALGMTSLEEKQ